MISPKLRILFIGTVDFSYSSLELLISNGFNICGVITKKTSTYNSDHKDLKPICDKAKIPIYFDEKSNNTTKIDFIKSMNPDIIYCFGWSYLLPKSILESTRLGVVGFHPAELPKNRGRHPIIWAIFLGLNSTGSSFFIMDEGADTGDIISQQKIMIDASDDAGSLYAKIKTIALKQIVEFSEEIQKNNGYSKRYEQPRSAGNSWRKRGFIDGKIDFRMNSLAIQRLIRALTKPYCGAHIEFGGENVSIWSAEVDHGLYLENIEPGKILEINDSGIVVKTYDGAIKLQNHDFKIIPKVGDYL